VSPDIDLAAAELFKLRKKMGISQQQVAERAGWNRSHVSHYETGYRQMSLQSLERYASGLGRRIEVQITIV
jgi:transcriptional regulator with XRE-family HTH domain